MLTATGVGNLIRISAVYEYCQELWFNGRWRNQLTALKLCPFLLRHRRWLGVGGGLSGIWFPSNCGDAELVGCKRRWIIGAETVSALQAHYG